MDREDCPKLFFLLCVEYRTTVLLRGVSLLKVVGNHILHKPIHQPSHLAAFVWNPQERFAKSFADFCGGGRSIRPETFGEVVPSVTTRSIKIGYSPETRRILLPPPRDRSVPPAPAGVSGPAGDSGVRQPETPGAASGNGSFSWAPIYSNPSSSLGCCDFLLHTTIAANIQAHRSPSLANRT